jgi:glyoxylase-like metal-dependent hydrolase (beta-lactamase superfamily II)
MRSILPVALPLLLGATAPGPGLIPGQFTLDRNPDGNSIIFEDEAGLVVVDTGRHKEHQAAILDYAHARGKPIVAIVNTHWHLDHTGGNQELRAAYPAARIYTSNAVRGALDGFLARSLERGKARLADPQVPDADKAETRLGVDAIEDRRDLLPDVAVTGTVRLPLGKGVLELYLAPHAATEGDTWIYDPASRSLVAGDLVVLPAPFFDTACAAGWRKALDSLAAVPFERMYPGHGPVLNRAQFETYRRGFDHLVDCAARSAPKQACIDGWRKDVAPLLTGPDDGKSVPALLDYYLDNVLRKPEQQKAFCGGS